MDEAPEDRAYAIWEKYLIPALAVTREETETYNGLHRFRVVGFERGTSQRIDVKIDVLADYPYDNHGLLGLDGGDAAVVLRINLLDDDGGIYAPPSPLHLITAFLSTSLTTDNVQLRRDPAGPIVIEWDY